MVASNLRAPLAALYVVLLLSGHLAAATARRDYFLPTPAVTVSVGGVSTPGAPKTQPRLDHACVVAHLKPVANSLKLLTLFYTSMLVAQAKPPATAIVGAVMLSNNKYNAPTSGAAWQGHLVAVGNAAVAALKECRVAPSSTSAGLSVTLGPPGVAVSIGTAHGRHLLEIPLWGKVLMAGTGIALAAAIIVVTDGFATPVLAPAIGEAAAVLGGGTAAAAEAMGLSLGASEVAGAVVEGSAVAAGHYLADKVLMDLAFEIETKSIEAAVESLDIGTEEERDEAAKWADFGGQAAFLVNDMKGAFSTEMEKAPTSVHELGKQMGKETVLADDIFDTLKKGADAGTASAEAKLEVDAFSMDAPQQSSSVLRVLADSLRAKQGNGRTAPKVAPLRPQTTLGSIATPKLNARAACTNLVAPNDGCLSGERVWCCAGVKSTRALQGPCAFLGPPGTTRSCPASGTPMRYCCPLWQTPGEASTGPAAITLPSTTTPAPTKSQAFIGPAIPSTYTVGGSEYVLCNGPGNMPVTGGMGVRMVGTNGCQNCFKSFPCPPNMACQPGRPTAGQPPSDTFSTCV